MAQTIARDPETADDLYNWWAGTHIEPGAKLTVEDDEVALVISGTDVLSTFGPGAHVVTSKSAPELAEHLGDPDSEIEICFITTEPHRTFDVTGSIGLIRDPRTGKMMQAGLKTSVCLRIEEPAKYLAVALAAENEPDDPEEASEQPANGEEEEKETGLEMMEDWVAGQIVLAMRALAAQKSGQAHDAKWFAGAMAESANPKLAEAGVTIESVESLDFTFEEAAPEDANADGAEAVNTMPATPAAKSAAAATTAPAAPSGFCGNCGTARTGDDKFCANCGQAM